MRRLLSILIVLVAVPAWGQYLSTTGKVNAQCAELTWGSSTGPTAAHSNDDCRDGWPIPEADNIQCGGASCASVVGTASNVNLALVNGSGTQQPSQFRVLGVWPRTGNARWVMVDGETSQAAGTADYSLYLCKIGTTGCPASGGGNFGGSNLATDNGSTITVAAGCTFTIQKAHFDLFHDVLCGATHVILGTAHGANDGLVIRGAATGLSMPAEVSCQSGGNPDITQCTTLYDSNADASSSCSIEENGPIRSVLKCTGGFVNGTTYYPDLGWTARLEFNAGKPWARVKVYLRNAQNDACVTANNCNNNVHVADVQYRSLEARETLNISGTLSFQFAGTPTGSGTTTSFPLVTGNLTSTLGTDYALLYQAYSKIWEFPDWIGSLNNPQSYIERTSGSNYAQSGWQALSSQSLTGVSTGSNTQRAGGWADISNSTGAGAGIGVYEMTPYWPKELKFDNGGTEAVVGIWPDQGDWPTASCASGFTDGTATPCHIPYTQPWMAYSIHDLWFDFHASTPANEANDYLNFQHPEVMRAAPGGTSLNAYQYYNAAVDATSGLRALPVEIPNPASEDTYYKSTKIPCSTTPGTCVGDVLDLPTGNGVQQMSVFRYYRWGNPGAGNQHAFDLAEMLLYLQRGLTGMYAFARQFDRMISEKSLPRSDFAGGWRGDCTVPECVALTQSSGFPKQTPVNSTYGISGDLIDADHAHTYGYELYYFLTGDEDAKEQLGEGFKDSFLNQNINQNNPYARCSSSCSATNPPGFIDVPRAVGHYLANQAQLSEYLRAVNDASADTIASPTALLGADNALANETHDVFMSMVGEPEPATPATNWSLYFYAGQNWGDGTYTSHGVSRKRGMTWFGGEGDQTTCDPTNTVGIVCNEGNTPPPWNEYVRLQKAFMTGILNFGIRQYELAADDVRGAGWVAGQNTVPAINAGAQVPAGTVFGDTFVHSMEYGWTRAELTDDSVVASGTVSCTTTTCNLVVGQNFTSGMTGTTITVNGQSYTATYVSGTQITLNANVLGGPLSNVPYLWTGFCSGTPVPSSCSNYATTGLPYLDMEDFQNTTPGQCGQGATRTSCPYIAGNGARMCATGNCSPAESENLWMGIGDFTGTTVFLDGTSWQSQTWTDGAPVAFEGWANHWATTNFPVGALGDLGHYILWGPLNYILHASDTPAPPQLKDLTITGGTCTLGASGTCTITWTAPNDVVAHDGLTSILKYTADGTAITNWIGFNNHNTTSTYSQCAQNAATDPNNTGTQSGCWLQNPANFTNFWAASDVITEPTLSSGTYTTSTLAAGTYHFALKYYGNGAAQTSFPLQVTVNLTGTGNVTSSPAGIDTSTGQTASFNSGTVVTLTATPFASYRFSSWTGCDSASGSVCTETMNASKSVTANFVQAGMGLTGIVK